MGNHVASTFSNLRHGNRVGAVYAKKGRPRPSMPALCLPIQVDAGYAAVNVGLIGDAISSYPASVSEEGSAASTVTIGSITRVTYTPATQAIAIGVTDEALLQVGSDVLDVKNFLFQEMLYPVNAQAYQSSTGLYALASALTAVGTSGADLEMDTLFEAHAAICTEIGVVNVPVVVILNAAGIRQLLKEQSTTASTVAAAQTMQDDVFIPLWEASGLPRGVVKMVLPGPIYVMEDPNPAALYTDSTDYFAPMFIPAVAPNGGSGFDAAMAKIAKENPEGLELVPSYGFAFRSNPSPARDLTAADSPWKQKLTTAFGTPINTYARSYTGTDVAIVDAVTSFAAVSNGVGARAVRYGV